MQHTSQTESAHDALSEGPFTDAELRAALNFVPDEFHQPGDNQRERFVKSVVANANAVGRSAYTVALFALDVA